MRKKIKGKLYFLAKDAKSRMKNFNREKSIKRAESRQKALDKIEVLDKPTELNNQMKLTFTPQIESGNDVLHVENLSKSFGTLHLFSNLSFDIKKHRTFANTMLFRII